MPNVTPANLGACLLKRDPRRWDLRRFLADGHEGVHSWVVQANYGSDLMAKDDQVVFW